MIHLPPTSTLFPYTTLFRSRLSQTLGAPPAQLAAQPRGTVEVVAAKAEPNTVSSDVYNDLQSVEDLLRSEEHTSELQSLRHLVCRLLLEKKKKKQNRKITNT